MAYMSRKHLSEEFDLSETTTDKVIRQLRNEIESGRYPPDAVLDYGRNVRVEYKAFKDCMKFGDALQDPYNRKLVPNYGG